MNLATHIQQKAANQAWLYACLDRDEDAFPYVVAEDGEGRIVSESVCYPQNQSQKEPKSLKKDEPRFVVNIPDGRGDASHYHQMVGKIVQEGFSSSRLAASRVFVVVGSNQPASIDPARNREFCEEVEKTDPKGEIAARRMGFLWSPQYECSLDNIYPPQKAFFLLKLLNSEKAEQVREKIDGSSHISEQIPFQRIREMILKSDLTRAAVEGFEQRAPTSSVYLTVMDADFQNVDRAFSRATEAIVEGKSPSVVGAAYTVSAKELPIIRLAVKIDAAVRAAMSAELPYSAYLPEPFLCVRVRKRELKKLSFLGGGRALESRRLIENGLKRGVLDRKMKFLERGLQTTAPKRWKTEKAKKHTTLLKKDLKTKPVLRAIRGLSQSHAHPKKWADQIYTALDFSCSQMTDATAPMMRIFHVYDPISRMFAGIDRFSLKRFDREMATYLDPLNSERKENLATAKAKLKKLGMEDAMIDQVERTARASGGAIYETLLNY